MTRGEYRNDYLNSEHWRHLKSQVMTAGAVCGICEQSKASDVHHMIYREVWDVVPTDLVPVCRPCHIKIHAAIDAGHISVDRPVEPFLDYTKNGIAMLSRPPKSTATQSVKITSELAQRLSALGINNRKQVFGVLKILPVEDLGTLAGMTVGRTVFEKLERLSRRKNWYKKKHCAQRFGVKASFFR